MGRQQLSLFTLKEHRVVLSLAEVNNHCAVTTDVMKAGQFLG